MDEVASTTSEVALFDYSLITFSPRTEVSHLHFQPATPSLDACAGGAWDNIRSVT